MRRVRRFRALVAAAAVIATAGCGALSPVSSPTPSRGPRGPVEAEFRTAPAVDPPLAALGAVWVPNVSEGTVSRIDPRTNRIVASIRVGDPRRMTDAGCGPDSVHSFMVSTLLNRRCDLPSDILAAEGSLWAADNADQALVRIDPGTNRVVQRIGLGAHPLALAAGEGSLWITAYFNDPPEVLRVDPKNGRVVAAVSDLPAGCGSGIAAGEGGVWVTCTYAQSVAHIDPRSNRVLGTAGVEYYPLAITVAPGAVLVHNLNSWSISRIDPATGQVVSTIRGLPVPVGRVGVDAMALGPDGLWVAGITIVRVASNRVVAAIDVSGNGVAEGFGSLWTASPTGTIQRINPRAAVPVTSG